MGIFKKEKKIAQPLPIPKAQEIEETKSIDIEAEEKRIKSELNRLNQLRQTQTPIEEQTQEENGEITEEYLINALNNIDYRLSKIEHFLRLDY